MPTTTALLNKQLTLARRILATEENSSARDLDGLRLAELTLELNRAFTAGMPFPAAWLAVARSLRVPAPDRLVGEQSRFARTVLRGGPGASAYRASTLLATRVLQLDRAIRAGVPLPTAWCPRAPTGAIALPSTQHAILQQA